MVPPPNPPHGDLAAELARALFRFVDVNKIDGWISLSARTYLPSRRRFNVPRARHDVRLERTARTNGIETNISRHRV